MPHANLETNVKSANEIYQRLIQPVEDRMIAIITRIMRDHHDAKDVLQEVLAVIWKNLKKIDRHPNPHAYILRICVTRSYDALRKKASRRREVRLDAHIEQLKQQPDASPERSFAIREAIALLPPKQAKAVFLRLIEGEDYAAMGAIMDCSAVTARSHLSKGRAKLRVLLTDWGLAPERKS